MGIQQLLLGGVPGAAADPVYSDTVFNTYCYRGNNGANNTNTNVDLSGDNEGLVWVKNRESYGHFLFDTERGVTKAMCTNLQNGEFTEAKGVSAFTSTGCTIGTSGGGDGAFSSSTYKYVAYLFKKSAGFFTMKKYNGTGSAQTISHDLGSVPGVIIIKSYSSTSDWVMFHRSLGKNKYIELNDDAAATSDGNAYWDNFLPTATAFKVGDSTAVNDSNKSYIAYIFAGGDSPSSTARSVALDGSDHLTVGSSSDYTMGTGDFTVECWARSSNTSNKGFFQISSNSGGLADSNYEETIAAAYNGSQWVCYGNGTSNTIHTSSSETFVTDRWYHIAYVRSSGTSKLYVNGVEKISFSDTHNYDGTDIAIGSYYQTGQRINGNISNFRVVKGTAIYTTPFTPPDTPLTSTTNTKLLCCNNASVTGSTVASGTIATSGDPTASTDSPTFNDADSYIFGENKNEPIIKCGSYTGTGATNNVVTLGFEPEFILFKNSNSDQAWAQWYLYDSKRGIGRGETKKYLLPIQGVAEEAYNDNTIDVTATGFIIQHDGVAHNQSGSKFPYIAIRRADGVTSKPPTAGTDVFAMDTGNNDNTLVNFDSNFPVDIGLIKKFDSDHSNGGTGSWYLSTRLSGNGHLRTDEHASLGSATDRTFDSSVGWALGSGYGDHWHGWMWKRSKACDVVIFKGTGNAHTENHSLGETPTFIIFKNMGTNSAACTWHLYHAKANSGSNPEDYYFRWGDYNDSNYDVTLGSTNDSSGVLFNSTAPTATTFSVGTSSATNESGKNIMALLFANVDGISKSGEYTGTGSTTDDDYVDVGFQPRFLIIKRSDSTSDWWIMDSSRGMGSGNDMILDPTLDAAQNENINTISISSNGFGLVSSYFNGSSGKYIYFAHA